jgi:hypothetical protein
MSKLHHLYYAIRYGEWSCGWEMYENKPPFGIYHTYYDGDHMTFHCYKLWVNVSY